MFVYFTILKIAMIALLQGFCHFGGGILACLIIGSVLEYIGAVLLGECENFVVREILFYLAPAARSPRRAGRANR